MKLSTLPQNRRSNSIKGPPSLESSGDVTGKSPLSSFWLFLYAAFCIISLALGFRLSSIFFLFLFSASSTNIFNVPFGTGEIAVPVSVRSSVIVNPIAHVDNTAKKTAISCGSSSSRVVVGCHWIWIRSWPHPNPKEVMKSHRIIERVQMEQKVLFGVKNLRTVIAVTPTMCGRFRSFTWSSWWIHWCLCHMIWCGSWWRPEVSPMRLLQSLPIQDSELSTLASTNGFRFHGRVGINWKLECDFML